MSYFDRANNQVTRKSFGSRVDKEFKREGVIPVKDRKKPDVDLVAEAAKQDELNKKVNQTKLEELKNKKAYDDAIKEGYENLKNELMKDIISEICVEALLVDGDIVNENLRNITEMVDNQIDELGGLNGIKNIVRNTNNPILSRMVNICEATAKKVGERNVREAQGNVKKVDFNLNKIELEEYDYRKKDMGIDTIVGNIKEKVFQVVQDEQKLSNDKQTVMDEIQSKVSELNAPVEEAMSFIFESSGVEEDTLFGSLMRKNYKNLIQTGSSPIFESFDYNIDEDILFENDEFDMDDVEFELEDVSDEELEDMFLKECNMLLNVCDDCYDEVLESVYQSLFEKVEKTKSQSDALMYKKVIRLLQESIEKVDEPEEDIIEETDARARLLSKLFENEDPSANMKTLEKEANTEIKNMQKNGKKVSEEVILCPKCGKEECKCKTVKESVDYVKINEKLDELCNKLNEKMETHDICKNTAYESLIHEINGETVLIPYLQTKDVNSSNLEFMYKTKLVCESIKNSLKGMEYLQEVNVLERIIELNLQSINETLEVTKERSDMVSKNKTMKMAEKYLNKIQHVIEQNNFEFDDSILESNLIFNSVEDVDKVFNHVKEYYTLESTDSNLMDLVMAEAIVEYTVLETMNTLRLVDFTKDNVRQMSRKNIEGVTEGLFSKKKSVDVEIIGGEISYADLDPNNRG